MKEIVFILSSLSDSHYRKRVEEFIEHGYNITVYGFKRKGQKLSGNYMYKPVILGEIRSRHFTSRLSLFNKSIKNIAKECEGKICFYSSLDIAIFAHLYIRSPYIYEVCDLTELTIGNSIVRKTLTRINRYTIKKSLVTIITSEGFTEYFNGIDQKKMWLIPNKVSPNIPVYDSKPKVLNMAKIKIGFVGIIRFESIYHFAQVCANYGKNIELHLFGIYSANDEWGEKIKQLVNTSSNLVFHGHFANPTDLPFIYDQIDLVLCTYTPSLGVKYAEPNKLYEAIYFRCPIIVSENVFLGDKVSKWGIGYAINAMDESAIKLFIEQLNPFDFNEKVKACKNIPQNECLNINDSFFELLKELC